MDDRLILVVDDEEAVRSALESVFQRADYTVITAESGEKALGILGEQKIHVMFLDLQLPGMNGLQLCHRIRKDNPISIAYAITGYVSLFDLSDCREAGFDDYFPKPVDVDKLLKAATSAFEKVDRWKKRDSA